MTRDKTLKTHHFHLSLRRVPQVRLLLFPLFDILFLSQDLLHDGCFLQPLLCLKLTGEERDEKLEVLQTNIKYISPAVTVMLTKDAKNSLPDA